ncbi:hypothetical protein M9Y10_023756 [Tritrichomonas musculus]|uniref:Uncharacterized protein n=1 Tax=Tritrichomonas musculus TaxID=1915356 RepID=A0ABR2KZ71_9EUKA
MNKALPVPCISRTASKDEHKRIVNIERRMFNLEKRMTRIEDSQKDKPKITEKQFFGRKDSSSDEKTDSYSDLEESSDSKSQCDFDPEDNDEFVVHNEIWNMRPGEKYKIHVQMNENFVDFTKTLSPRQREAGMTIDQIRRHMEIFFEVRLTNRCIAGLSNFRKYFYGKQVRCGKTTIRLFFYKKTSRLKKI